MSCDTHILQYPQHIELSQNNASGLALITCTSRCITQGMNVNLVAIKLCKLKCLIRGQDKPSVRLGDIPVFLVEMVVYAFPPIL